MLEERRRRWHIIKTEGLICAMGGKILREIISRVKKSKCIPFFSFSFCVYVYYNIRIKVYAQFLSPARKGTYGILVASGPAILWARKLMGKF